MYEVDPRLKGVPGKATESFRRWRDGEIDLDLLFYVPRGNDLLSLQTQGRRCVSCLITKSEILNAVEDERDVLSFCLHDFLHASHFFAPPEIFRSQRFLSAFFLHLLNWESFERQLNQDSLWRKDFLYIATDMNAHPVHVFLSFYSKMLDYFKRIHGPAGENQGSAFTPVDPLTTASRWVQFWERFIKDLQGSGFPLTNSFYEFLGSLGAHPVSSPNILSELLEHILDSSSLWLSKSVSLSDSSATVG